MLLFKDNFSTVFERLLTYLKFLNKNLRYLEVSSKSYKFKIFCLKFKIEKKMSSQKLLIAFFIACLCVSTQILPGTAQECRQYHTIAAGDTLDSISRSYNVPLDSVMSANPSVDALNLEPGSQICIPS